MVGISWDDNCSADIFIGCYLEFKMNFKHMQGRIEIWLDVTVNNSTNTISKIFSHKNPSFAVTFSQKSCVSQAIIFVITHFQVILAGTLTGVQGNIRCNVLRPFPQ